MLFKNLTLALGLITASAIGGVTATTPINKNNDFSKTDKEFIKVKNNILTGDKNELLKPNNLENLWHDICMVNDFDEAQFTDVDRAANLEHLFKFYKIDDESISTHEAVLNSIGTTRSLSRRINETKAIFKNDSNEPKTVTSPSTSVQLKSYMSFKITPLKLSKAKVNFSIDAFRKDYTIELAKTNTMDFWNLDETVTSSPEKFAILPKSKGLLKTDLIEEQEVSEYSCGYSMNWTKNQYIRIQSMNGNNFGKINIGSTLISIANRNAQNDEDYNFTSQSKDLFIYTPDDNGGYFLYNIPMTNCAKLHSIEYSYQNLTFDELNDKGMNW